MAGKIGGDLRVQVFLEWYLGPQYLHSYKNYIAIKNKSLKCQIKLDCKIILTTCTKL